MKYNYIKNLKSLGLIAMSILSIQTLQAQTLQRVKPVWWFGQSGAVNYNTYRGTTGLDLTLLYWRSIAREKHLVGCLT